MTNNCDLCNGVCVHDAGVGDAVWEEIGGAARSKPVVLPDVLHRSPLHGVGLEHMAQQGHHALIQILWDREHAGLDLPKQGRHLHASY